MNADALMGCERLMLMVRQSEVPPAPAGPTSRTLWCTAQLLYVYSFQSSSFNWQPIIIFVWAEGFSV